MKKLLLTLALAAVLIAALTITALGAELVLPDYEDSMSGYLTWFSNGTNGVDTPLTVEILSNATSLVIELKSPQDVQIVPIHTGDGDGWCWNQVADPAIMMADVVKDGKFTLDMTAYQDFYSKCDYAAFHIAFWSGYMVSELEITKATLYYDAPAAGGGGGGGSSGGGGGSGSPKTGDVFLPFLGLFMISAAGFVFIKKVKA